ncbi:MAG: UDP-N-acetylmuramoyl-L-alanyl-D-glutamate--2,6-diaminopimelate ligase [Rhodoferax sp.]
MQHLHSPQEAAQWLRNHVRGTLQADSRKLAAGDGFIAWPGAAVDARRFVAPALQAGAAACLVEAQGAEAWQLQDDRVATYHGLKADTGRIAAAFFDHPSRSLAVCAVTGTNGKTSTTWWLAQALSALAPPYRRPCGMVGTLGVGTPPAPGPSASATALHSVVGTGLTTPDPVLLQRTLREFLDHGLQACAMEASSIGIEEHRLDDTHLQLAILTNFTQDHLDYHGTMQAYWAAKQRLFDWPGLAHAVINIDDAKGAELAQALASRPMDVWTVGRHCGARLRASNVAYGSLGLRLDLTEGAESVALQTRLIGGFNVSNMLGVLAALRALGVPLVEAANVCAQLHPVPGRMECLGGVDVPLVVVDYAHTPDALAQALTALRPLAQQRGGRLWCVFGCGGDRDASKRPLMGAIAAKNADCTMVTSDNPRSEKPEAIIAQVLLGMPHGQHGSVQVDRAMAIADAVARADERDVVLIAGKGHEATQDIAGVKHPFLDSAHAQQALQRRGNERQQP